MLYALLSWSYAAPAASPPAVPTWSAPRIAGWAPPSPDRAGPTALGDFDGDGLPDLLLDLRQYYASAAGAVRLRPWETESYFGDLNGDYAPDLLGSAGRPVVWLGGEPEVLWVAVGPPKGKTAYAGADLNGDGRTDLVGVSGQEARIWFDGRKDAPAVLELPAAFKTVVSAGDLDHDGYEDVVFGLSATQAPTAPRYVLFGAASAAAVRTTTLLGPGGPDSAFFPADLDADGKDELIFPRRTPAGAIEALDVAGEDTARPVPGSEVLSGCTDLDAANLFGDARDEIFGLCGGTLRIWSPGSGSVLTQPLPPGAVPARWLVPGVGGPQIPITTTYELRLLDGPDFVYEGAAVVRRPTPPGSPTLIHWAEISAKRRQKPVGVDLPAGTWERCLVRITVGPDGETTDVVAVTCANTLFASVKPAMMSTSWHPYKENGVAMTVTFDLGITFKGR